MENIYVKSRVYKKALSILLLLNGCVFCTSSVANSWTDFTVDLTDSMKKCPVNLEIFDCLRHSSLTIFDKVIASDVIPLTPEVSLLKNQFVRRNGTTERSRTAFVKESWSEHILKKIVKLFRTHSLSIDLRNRYVSGRGPHRRRNQMLPMMILGVTALGAFTIPMGFQFLSVISGKALLLAKMALILAIMNGAKRVAASGVHYGLYHADPHHHHGINYLDRGDMNRPRSIDM